MYYNYDKIAFLIEGSRDNPQYLIECVSQSYPLLEWLLPNQVSKNILEVRNLAYYINKEAIFDPIKSYCSTLLWKELIKNIHKSFIKGYILLELHSRCNAVTLAEQYTSSFSQNCKNTINYASPPILKAYKELYQTSPSWLNNINPNSLIKEIEEYGGITKLYAYNQYLINIGKLPNFQDITKLSNNLSRENIFKYLEYNQNIETVYGVVGLLHILLLDDHAEIICAGQTFRFLELNQQNKNAYFYLFGGSHYDNLAVLFLKEIMIKHQLPINFLDSIFHSISQLILTDMSSITQNPKELMQESCIYVEQHLLSKTIYDLDQKLHYTDEL